MCEKNILRWKASDGDNLGRKKGSGTKVTYPDFEVKLLEYFKDLRSNGIGLSTRKFILYARTEAKKNSNIRIKFSRGWLTKFMLRNTTRTPIEEINDITTKFRKKIHDLIITQRANTIQITLSMLTRLVLKEMPHQKRRWKRKVKRQWL